MKKYLISIGIVFLISACQPTVPPSSISGSPSEDRTFVSKALGISFQLPDHISNCVENEIDTGSEPSSIKDFVPQGWKTEITCDTDKSLYMIFTAVSQDYKCYEGYCPKITQPTSEEIKNYDGNGPWPAYDLTTEQGQKHTIAISHDNIFSLVTYYPLNRGRYGTVRIIMTLSGDTEESIPDYENRIMNRQLPEPEMKRMKDFERLLRSIQ